MITESDATRSSDRERLLWSLLASAVLNLSIAVTLSGHLSLLRYTHIEERRERLIVSSALLRIEYRSTPQPHRKSNIAPIPQANAKPSQPQRTPSIARVSQPELQRTPNNAHNSRPKPHTPKHKRRRGTVPAPPVVASLSVPPGWERQDFGNVAETEVTLWLDWKKQTANFVPRLFLWQKKEEPDMPEPSLQEAVQNVLSTLRNEDDELYTSKAQRVCRGERPGWFVSYVKREDDPPMHFDETLFVANGTIYRATYIRPADQPEDAQAREALNTLC